MTRPACAGSPLDWHSPDPLEQEACKAICRGCGLRESCYVGAVQRDEPCGVWGAELFGVVEMAEPVAHVRVQVYAPRHGENRFYDRCTAGVDGRACDDCRAAHALHVSQWRAAHTAAPVRPPVDVPQLQFAF